MEKLNIVRAKWDSKKSDGTPLINKFGKPYFKVGIQTKEYGEQWLNGLLSFPPDKWEGSVQELEVFDEEYNGRTYKKFKLPPKGPAGGMSELDKTLLREIKQDIYAVNVNVLQLVRRLEEAGVLKSDKIDYPEYEGPVGF